MRIEIVLSREEILALIEKHIRDNNPNGVYVGNGQDLSSPDLFEHKEYRVVIGE